VDRSSRGSHADGRHLLTVQTDQQVNDLMMIENLR
jgi:hypothetical protein